MAIGIRKRKGNTRQISLAVAFVVLTAALTFTIQRLTELDDTYPQYWLFPLGMGLLLSGLTVLFLYRATEPAAPDREYGQWHYPLLAAGLAFCGMLVIYLFIGMWPAGSKTGMIVDMHHQYAPLLAQLRTMILEGKGALYNFEIGIGTSFLPLFAYYLASPFNLLLLLFPARYLAEGLLLITLLKNALCAFFFALSMQYIYRRRDMLIPTVAVMYSLMMYLLAYSWNIMWLDCVMVLPLIVMNFERLMRTGKFLPYILSLAYALYCNYYIGFMVCIFLVLYYLAYVLRKQRAGRQTAISFGRFVIGSLLGGGLAMFLIVPVALSLGDTSAAGASLPELLTEFDLFRLPERLMVGAEPSIRYGSLPNIYCGILAALLVPVFATTSAIPLRRRITWLSLLGVMTVSMTLNIPDLLWHGLHSPNDLPYRFSFLVSFVLLIIAYETLLHMDKLRGKQVGLSAAALAIWLVLEEKLDEEVDFRAVYLSLALVAVYVFILLLCRHRKLTRRGVQALLALVVVTEMTVNGCYTMYRLNSNEYFTEHQNYTDNVMTDGVRAMVKRTQEIGDASDSGTFYRMEFVPRRTCVDTALFNYRGITVFASSNSYETTRLMGSLGYAVNGVNSYLYHSFVAPCDSLLGIRYLALESNITTHKQLKQIDSVTTTRDYGDGQIAEQTYFIYENPQALPLGYMVDSAVKDFAYSYYNPFLTQNSLYQVMTNTSDDIYDTMQVEEYGLSEGCTVSGVSSFTYTPAGEDTAGEFLLTADRRGQYFAYVDCRSADTLSVDVDGGNSYTVSPNEPYIVDLGTLTKGKQVTVTVGAEKTASGNIYLCRLNREVYERDVALLAQGGMQVTRATGSVVSGVVKAQKAGTLFVTVPYDEGWTVTVDGKKAATYSAADGMLGVDVAAGTHKVEMRFSPRGLWPGLILSGIALVLTVLLGWFQRERRPHRRAVLPEPDATVLLPPADQGDAPLILHVDGNPLPDISLEELMREQTDIPAETPPEPENPQ